MRKRSYTKVVAIVSIVAILSLTAPGLFAADTFRHFFSFERLLNVRAVFLNSFLYFTPFYDIERVLAPAVDSNDANPIKVLGGLDVDRVSRDD
ncbi:MAG: hypothetical protein JSV17_03335 [Candidatus Aminicenantes bacterium]|nr:MAG: hypothetical protein JSV17_03335 [Candidatus Aminicenantes bacterium]